MPQKVFQEKCVKTIANSFKTRLNISRIKVTVHTVTKRKKAGNIYA